MNLDRHLRPATETSRVVSYGGKTIPRWRTSAILKIVISPYLSEKSSDFDEILYTAADFELDERHVIKNEKVELDRLRVRENVFLVLIGVFSRSSFLSKKHSILLFCYIFYSQPFNEMSKATRPFVVNKCMYVCSASVVVTAFLLTSYLHRC